MLRKLNSEEQGWIDHLLQFDFRQRSILRKQIEAARITREDFFDWKLIKFFYDNEVEPFPFIDTKPIEMMIWRKGMAPVGFFFLMKNGRIHELEAYTLDMVEFPKGPVDFSIGAVFLSENLTPSERTDLSAGGYCVFPFPGEGVREQVLNKISNIKVTDAST